MSETKKAAAATLLTLACEEHMHFMEIENTDSGINYADEGIAGAVENAESAIGAREKPAETLKGGKARSKIPSSAYMAVAIAVVAVLAIVLILYTGVLSPAVVAGDNVSVYYTGSFTNGTIFSSNVGGSPISFIAGSTQLIPGFSNAVIGMKEGQNKTVTLPPDEAYGPINASLFISVPVSKFSKTSNLSVGSVVTSVVNGTTVEGVIVGSDSSNVIVDLNPPLAGKTLIFSIKVVKIN